MEKLEVMPETPRATEAHVFGALWQLDDLPELSLCSPKQQHPKRMAFHENCGHAPRRAVPQLWQEIKSDASGK